MTKIDTKEINRLREYYQYKADSTTDVEGEEVNADIQKLCNAYDEAQKEIEIFAKVVVHYAFLEVNDNGDYNYPANKALTQLGYSEEHKFEKVEKSWPLARLWRQNETKTKKTVTS